MTPSALPVAVIGAGPIRLAAVAELAEREQDAIVLEQGDQPSAAARQWGLFLAGMRSFGQVPSFLAMTGFEQVRSSSAALAGDLQAARAIELQLPDPDPQPLTLTASAVGAER